MVKKTTGHLFKRGKAYYITYKVNGKRFSYVLHDDDGKPITLKEKALARMSVILAPLQARSAADRAALTAQAAEAAEQTAIRADTRLKETIEKENDRKTKQKTLLENCWNVYIHSRKRAKCFGDLDNKTIPQKGTNAYNYYLYWGVFKRYIASIYSGDILLCNLNSDDINGFCDKLKRKKSAGTYNKYIRFLRHFCKVVCNEIGVENNLFEDIEYSDDKRIKSRKTLTLEQVKCILDMAKGEMHTLFLIGFYTGLRLGDVATLKWSEIDLQRRIITRVPNKTAKSSGAVVKIGIPMPLFEELKQLKETADSDYILPDMARRYNLNRNNLSRPIRDIFKQAGLQNDNGYVEYGFHSFRHTYVTMQAESGTPVAILEKMVGHSSPVMTEHYISGLTDDAALKFADSVYSPFQTPADMSPREKLLARLAGLDDSQLEKVADFLNENGM